MSGVGKQSLIDRRRDCENRQQQQMHDLARHLLYHNPVLVLLSIVVPALHFHASAHSWLWKKSIISSVFDLRRCCVGLRTAIEPPWLMRFELPLHMLICDSDVGRQGLG
jgi:hypothetical protein